MTGRIRSKLVKVVSAVILLSLLAPQAASANIFHTHDRKVPDIVVGGMIVGLILITITALRLWRRFTDASEQRVLVTHYEAAFNLRLVEDENEARVAAGEAPVPVPAVVAPAPNARDEGYLDEVRWQMIRYGGAVAGTALVLGAYLTYTQVLL